MVKFKDEWVCLAGECRANVLPLLHEMSGLIAEGSDLTHILAVLLQTMQQKMNIVRGTVSLYDPNSGNTYIHESFGLTNEEQNRGIYQFGEGITGQVVESGKTMIIPRIANAQEFLSRTRDRSDVDNQLSFLCIPIKRGQKVLGTISAERTYDEDFLLKLDADLLNVLAAMIAQSVEIYLLENVDRISLLNENRRL